MEGTSVTDLSDPIRPQKVCEMFSELYDYQWTEAFECLTSETKTTDSRSNRDITQRLLNTLMDCYEFCNQEAESQIKRFAASLTFNDKEKEETKVLPLDTQKKLRNFIKDVAPEIVKFLKCKYPSKEQPKALKSYEERCLECCWYACIQSPPLHLRTDFTTFDDNQHRGYQSSGHFVDYVVWPGIYIERNGPLLSKAVIEGCDEKKTPPSGANDKSPVSGKTISFQEQELKSNDSANTVVSVSENEFEGKHVARIQIGANDTKVESTANTTLNHTTNSNSAIRGPISLQINAAELESKRSELKETKTTTETKIEPKPARKELTNMIERSLSSQEPTLQRTPSAILDVSPEELEDRKSTLKEIKTPDTRQQPKEIGTFNFG